VQEVVLPGAPAGGRGRLSSLKARARAFAPTSAEALAALASAFLLVFAFPDFDLWPLAWVALAPLLASIARRPRAPQAFVLGWLAGTVFFYASCYWLTYPMIHYAGIPAWVAYPLFLPAPLVAGLFPALFAAALARLCGRLGPRALFAAPLLWAASEWARLGLIGQLWNAVGYSQAYAPALIQGARFGGVYLVGFLVLAVNAALAYSLVRRDARSALRSLAAVACVALALVAFHLAPAPREEAAPRAVVVAVQPNVIPDFDRPPAEYYELTERHFAMSREALRSVEQGGSETDQAADLSSLPRVVVWPESPMNFSLGRNRSFRERVARFASEHRVSLLFNSLEPAPANGGYNAAVLVDERGRAAFQYDKIRLLPFGEYVPLPAWLPGASLVGGVVGDFTPGARFTLMPLGQGAEAPRAGVFICIESAYPYIARTFAAEGADVLVNITNDAYQGDTAVMRQHLANSVFRAVETGRTLLRVTNTGITARVTPRGEVLDATDKFQTAVRVWTVSRAEGGETFYTRFGDLFVALCAVLTVVLLVLTARPLRLSK
jgi:apolipoprotein N-acyltransferase